MEDCYEISVSLKLIDLKNIFWIEKKVIYNFFFKLHFIIRTNFQFEDIEKKKSYFLLH